jgi:alpha/beta superfamily hydrolase
MEDEEWLKTGDGVRLEMHLGSEGHMETMVPGVAVICHPHPLQGGDMTSSVVRSLSQAAREVGYVPLLFNFRGAGKSEGFHTGGLKEVDDVDAAMSTAREMSPEGKVILLGYSFGASMATRWLNKGGSADAFIGVAVPSSSDFPDYTGVPSLFVSGEQDDVAPFDDGMARSMMIDGVHVIIEDADHFFLSGLEEIKEAVKGFISLTCPLE